MSSLLSLDRPGRKCGPDLSVWAYCAGRGGSFEASARGPSRELLDVFEADDVLLGILRMAASNPGEKMNMFWNSRSRMSSGKPTTKMVVISSCAEEAECGWVVLLAVES